jgi:hypothetical protein
MRPVVIAAAFGLCLAPRAALGDDKKVCADAYLAAQSRRAEHKLLEARAQLRACAARECSSLMRGQMTDDCTRWLGEVEAVLPTVLFVVKDASGHDVQAVTVSMDDKVVADKVTGIPVEADPGAHTFTFTDPLGKLPSVHQSVVVAEGSKRQVIEVTMAAAVAPGPVPASAPAEAPANDAGSSPLRTASWFVGGAGVVAAGIGLALALGAKSSYDDAIGCSGSVCKTQAGLDSSNSARSTGDAATVVLVGGAVLVAAGVTLWLVAPSASRPATVGVASWGLGVTPGGLAAAGSF